MTDPTPSVSADWKDARIKSLELLACANRRVADDALGKIATLESALAEARRDGERLRVAVIEARRWIGDGDMSDGLDRRFWTVNYAAAVDQVDTAIANRELTTPNSRGCGG